MRLSSVESWITLIDWIEEVSPVGSER
jgi:hypothetical protein